MSKPDKDNALHLGNLGSAPQWAANIVIVFAFLGYMHSQDTREDKVAEQRIATCHAVQDRGVDVMDRLSVVMAEYQHDCESMRDSFDRLERVFANQAESFERLERVLIQQAEALEDLRRIVEEK